MQDIWISVRDNQLDLGMFICENAKHFIRKALAAEACTFKIYDHFLKLLLSFYDSRGL